MDIEYIKNNNIIGRYVSGSLDDKQSEQFEYVFFHDAELASLVELEQFLQEEILAKKKSKLTLMRRSFSIAAVIIVGALLLSLVYINQPITSSNAFLTVTTPSELVDVVTLKVTRSGAGSVPADKVPVPSNSNDQIVLGVSLPDDGVLKREYHFFLVDPGGNSLEISLVELEQNKPVSQEIYLHIPAFLLQPGTYQLIVEHGDAPPIKYLYQFLVFYPDSNISSP